MRVRKIAKYGNADMIRLKPKDREDLEWEYGDEVDIDGCKKVKNLLKDKQNLEKLRTDSVEI